MATSIDYRVDGAVGGGQPGLGPRFNASMPDNGYLWWYVDGLSDDGQYGFTIIAFIGSVFSPYYKWARYRRPTDPAEHSCMHVVLYGPDRRRWAMTERPSGALKQSSHRLEIGPSAMTWEDGCLTVDIDERCAPLPRSLQGQIRLFADCVYDRAFLSRPGKSPSLVANQSVSQGGGCPFETGPEMERRRVFLIPTMGMFLWKILFNPGTGAAVGLPTAVLPFSTMLFTSPGHSVILRCVLIPMGR